ncbi:hypothetical protein [Planotetraspora phitsanulokensis]|uniref:Uncharacterized protein n=1 Tax=Planotetraspora phitsanulokensis TaxID=575192 RepID=A0A8J3UCL4_9ACTN|nr:hypothetical protein [Planotetraspora phitsanulokensis]GII42758.1 hypothetical protein Pph01_77610 [Planotetraspora phitsanulokensis]
MPAHAPSVHVETSAGSARTRDLIARALLILAAVGALAAVAGAVGAVADAGPATRFVETWRMLGFGVFAGVFLLLGYRPRLYAGIWELAILNKLGLTVAALSFGSGTDGAGAALIADGAVTLILLAAYVLSRGWTAWSTARAIA